MCIIATAIILLAIALIMLFIDLKEFDGEHCRNIFSAFAPANIKKTFCIADAAVLLYWLSCIISTLQSEYLYESFWGNEGRFCGLFLITLYVFFYFIITRLWKPQKWILELFLISGVILCLVGITDYFKMDIFHFRDHISVKQANIFTSTIGNINTYTSYVALLIGYSASMFVKSRKLFSGLWYYACYVIAVFAIIMGCSDNAYLALGMLFAFLPFYLFQSKQDTLRYLTLIASFITAILCISLINQIYGDAVLGIDGLFNVLANTSALPVLTILFWLLVLAFYWFVVKNPVLTACFPAKSWFTHGAFLSASALPALYFYCLTQMLWDMAPTMAVSVPIWYSVTAGEPTAATSGVNPWSFTVISRFCTSCSDTDRIPSVL